jgi:pyruvate ferredoxin oxidoreductase gamma subunit
MSNKKIIEITFHGRGGQTAITASQLLAELAFESGFKDAIAIPIIGAERRGAPINSYSKLSKDAQIKSYSSVTNPDFMLIFDITLLKIPGVFATIKEGVILILNTDHKIDINNNFPRSVKIYMVDATGISLKHGLEIEGFPILNIPMLGAFAKVSGFYDLDTMEKIIKRNFGSRADRNMKTARDAFETVKEMI